MLRCVQQSKVLRFQTSSIAANSVGDKSVTRTAAVVIKRSSNWHALLDPSSGPRRWAALSPRTSSAFLLLLQQHKQQLVCVRLITTLGLQKTDDEAGANFSCAPRGSTAISSNRKRRSSGGGSADPDLFEEWLKDNPLPDVVLKGNKQGGNGGPSLDALGELRATGAEELREYDNNSTTESKGGQSGREKVRTRDAAEQSQGGPGELGMPPDTNGNFLRGQEATVLTEMESPSYRVDDFGDATKVDGLSLGQSRKFSWQETGDVLYECLCLCDELVWDSERRRFVEVNQPQGRSRIEFVPPLIQPPPSSCCTPREFLQSLNHRKDRKGNRQLLALLSSSAAALGIFQDGTLLLHKVITAYTVRAKQGKSQLKYLRQGGPGRMTVGGAIRAREADRFGGRVCAKLNEWGSEIEDCEVLFFSGTTRVWNEVYAEDDPKMPVPRNDSRWFKVPHSIHEPRLREVQRVFYGLSHGAFGYTYVEEDPP